MLSGLVVALRVIIAPNSAFVQIRDDDARYFPWSVGVFMLEVILASLVNPVYAELGGPWWAAWDMAGGLLAGILFTAVIYMVGRRLGGNRAWRKVFSVMFYTHAISYPLLIVALVLLAGGLWTDDSLYETLWTGDGRIEPGSTIQEAITTMLYLLAIAIAGVIAFMVWATVVCVKAVKVVNGFGTAKAFSMVVLAFVVVLAASLLTVSLAG